MSKVVEQLADLTGFRDRDVLDMTLVGAIKDLVRPQLAAIYRRVGEGEDERWLTRAHLRKDDTVATADPAWVSLEHLPLLSEHPHRVEALNSGGIVELAGTPNITVFPVATDREVVGVLELHTERSMGRDAKQLVASILRIYRNFQGLLDYSERDTLTGLLNRKTFDEAFLKAASEPRAAPVLDGEERRQPAPLSNWLGVIDIDHFKRVNDNFGHLIGDEVLLLLSRLMRASFRFDDKLYRFGGEEFVVLMRCNGEEEAAQAFERLRANTEAYGFPQVGRITVSVGFSALRAGDTPSAAFERADKAVYFAKGNGRNRVCSHAELVAQGHLKEDDKTGDVELF